MFDDFKKIRKTIYTILDSMGDDKSKLIFERRLMYSLTGNESPFYKDIIFSDFQSDLFSVAIFGCGNCGQILERIIEMYSYIDVVCFIDNFADRTELINGKPILSLEQFLSHPVYKKSEVVIGSVDYYHEIKQQLDNTGVTISALPIQFIDLNKLHEEGSCKTQYFDIPYLTHAEREVFIDGGGLNGETTFDFLKWCGDFSKSKSVVVFEPSIEQADECEKNLRKEQSQFNFDFKVVKKGLYDNCQELKFNTSPHFPKSACVSNYGDTAISVMALDDYDFMHTGFPTFIKLDIEGCEYKALQGMTNIIRTHKPKLAVSIYHKPEDIWEIPLLIKSIRNDYIFYLRHYSWNLAETVLYAI